MQPITVKFKEKEVSSNENLEKCETNEELKSSSNESLNHVVDELVEAALATNQYSQGSTVSSESLDEALTLNINKNKGESYKKDEFQDLPDEIFDEINENEKKTQDQNNIDLNSTTDSYQQQTIGK